MNVNERARAAAEEIANTTTIDWVPGESVDRAKIRAWSAIIVKHMAPPVVEPSALWLKAARDEHERIESERKGSWWHIDDARHAHQHRGYLIAAYDAQAEQLAEADRRIADHERAMDLAMTELDHLAHPEEPAARRAMAVLRHAHDAEGGVA